MVALRTSQRTQRDTLPGRKSGSAGSMSSLFSNMGQRHAHSGCGFLGRAAGLPAIADISRARLALCIDDRKRCLIGTLRRRRAGRRRRARGRPDIERNVGASLDARRTPRKAWHSAPRMPMLGPGWARNPTSTSSRLDLGRSRVHCAASLSARRHAPSSTRRAGGRGAPDSRAAGRDELAALLLDARPRGEPDRTQRCRRSAATACPQLATRIEIDRERRIAAAVATRGGRETSPCCAAKPAPSSTSDILPSAPPAGRDRSSIAPSVASTGIAPASRRRRAAAPLELARQSPTQSAHVEPGCAAGAASVAATDRRRGRRGRAPHPHKRITRRGCALPAISRRFGCVGGGASRGT